MPPQVAGTTGLDMLELTGVDRRANKTNVESGTHVGRILEFRSLRHENNKKSFLICPVAS